MQPKIRITWIQILAELLKIRTFTNLKIPPKKSLFDIIFVKISAQYSVETNGRILLYDLQNNSVPNLPVLKNRYRRIILLLYFSFLCIISTVRVPTQNFQFYLAEAILLTKISRNIISVSLKGHSLVEIRFYHVIFKVILGHRWAPIHEKSIIVEKMEEV